MGGIDWNAIKAAYVTGAKSYRQLAKEYDVSNSKVCEHGRLEDWPGLRKEFREKAALKAIENEVDREADRLGKILQAANAMSDVIQGVFEDTAQFHRHIVTDTFISEDGGKEILTTEKQFEKVDSRAIKDLTGALKDMTLVLRNLYNLPTQAEAEAQRIAAERLNMDKRKMEAESNADKKIVVKLEGDLEAYAK